MYRPNRPNEPGEPGEPGEPIERPAGPVTALEPDPRRPGSVRVYLGGRLYCTVAQEAVAEEGLRIGLALDDAQRERLDRAADAEAAFRTVLRAIAARAYARVDLGRRLVRKGHPREAVEAALARAERLGLLDDAAYAVNFVQTRAPLGRGPARLRRDLLARGVERALVDRAIAEQWPEGPDADAVLALAERRARQLGDLPRPVKRRRLLAYLTRRGFGGHEVVAIVARVVG
ncbi:MAG TPA: regulatory protein RecX [Gemmatimonadales bacterium]|nr:regulatory protein RecX [Gemmatimonadales bacterium]